VWWEEISDRTGGALTAHAFDAHAWGAIGRNHRQDNETEEIAKGGKKGISKRKVWAVEGGRSTPPAREEEERTGVD